MDKREFFAAVVKLRKLQKKRERCNDRDRYLRQECKQQEQLIDCEIKRVDLVMRELAQPRFFDLSDDEH